MPSLEHVAAAMAAAPTAEGLRQNPFRLFGLRVDLSTKELDQAIKDLSIQMQLGAELSHGFALGGIDDSALAQSGKRLRDSVQRICDECFWFWPLDLGVSDVALDLIANGDVAGAYEAWKEFTEHPEWGPIAYHNLAIVDLLRSFDDSSELPTLARHAKQFLGSEVIVSRLRARLRTLDDARLPRNAAPEIILELRKALACNQVSIGLERMEQQDTVRGFRNIRCAQTVAGDETLMGEIVENLLAADLRRLDGSFEIDAEKATDRDWRKLMEDTNNVINRLKHFPALERRAEIIGNNAAKALRRISLFRYNKKDDRTSALEITTAAQKVATGEILAKLNEDLAAIKDGIENARSDAAFDPIHRRIKALDDGSYGLHFYGEASTLLNDLNQAVNAGHSKKRADVLYHNLGWTIRGKAIDANNLYKDNAAASRLIELAKQVVQASQSRGLPQEELRAKLMADAATLEENRRASAYSHSSGRKDSCLVPLVALLCLTGAASYAAPLATSAIHHWLKHFFA